MKFLIIILVGIGLFLGFRTVQKLRENYTDHPPAAKSTTYAIPVASPSPSATPHPVPASAPSPTPKQRVFREVPLHHAGAMQVVQALTGANIPDAAILPSASNDSVTIIAAEQIDLDVLERAARAYDDSARLITVHALVGRYTRGKGHAVGLFDYLANNAQRAGAKDVADIMASLAVDLTTGVATMGGTVTARMVLDLMSQYSASDGRFRVESRPMITTISGQVAEFSTGREIPVSTTVNSQATTQTSIDYKTAAFRLKVVPTLRTDGSVRLVLAQENSEVTGTIEVDGNQVPTISTQKADTVVDLRPGQVLYLGGIQSVLDETSDKGVPFVRKIFPLSLIAGRNVVRHERSELVIVLAVEVERAGGPPGEQFGSADPHGFIGDPEFRPADSRKPQPAARGTVKKSAKSQ